jgi:sec-independent protein translocase protein TatA
MPGLHWPELIILVAVALLIFGPKRLPEMGSSIGKTIKEFQRSMREVTEPEKPATPAALPQAQVDAQVTPKAITPAENTTVPATHAESTAE